MRFPGRFLFKLPLLLVAIVVLGWIVKALWNWIIPYLFVGTHPIDYARAIGLLILSRILVGGFHGHREHKQWRRWKHMTHSEKEQLYRAATDRWHHDTAEGGE